MADVPTLFLDTETYSETPIRDGTHRYAEDVEIMIASWAFDDPIFGEGDVRVEDLQDHPVGLFSDELMSYIEDPSIPIVMHNGGMFDRTVIRYAQGIAIDPERIIDTMVQAVSHGLPGGLDKLSVIFKLGELSKQQGGKELIQLFCKPAPKNQKLRRRDRHTHPEEWQRFLSYAGGDIPPMRELRRQLPNWNYPGQGRKNFGIDERQTWLLDQKINDRGFKVDVALAEAAVELLAIMKDRTDTYLTEETWGDVTSAGQRDKLLAYLLKEYGVSLPDMQKSTLERRIDDPNLPMVVRELLSVRLDASMASTSKYAALLRTRSTRDNRLRGTLQFCGAARTGRWAGRLFQPQNLVRTPDAFTRDIQEETIATIKSGVGDLMLANPMRSASYCLRGSIIAADGKKIVAADLSGIEARVLPWLAGEEWKLQAYREIDQGIGEDMYRRTAGKILGKPPEMVTKDERQGKGKVPDLACGYQGSVGAFYAIANLYNFEISEDEARRIVELWRDENPAIRQFWNDLENGAREAILSPNRVVQVGEHIAFHRWREWLRMRLPSGRVICYCQPALERHPKFGGLSISYLGINNYTRKWERIFTYGGKFAAEATQGTARDVMASNMPLIEDAGYPIILTVHDEVITETPDDPHFTSDQLCALLARTPDWADDRLPIAAGGFEAYRYRKD